MMFGSSKSELRRADYTTRREVPRHRCRHNVGEVVKHQNGSIYEACNPIAIIRSVKTEYVCRKMHIRYSQFIAN
jgi:hypothetical protein